MAGLLAQAVKNREALAEGLRAALKKLGLSDESVKIADNGMVLYDESLITPLSEAGYGDLRKAVGDYNSIIDPEYRGGYAPSIAGAKEQGYVKDVYHYSRGGDDITEFHDGDLNTGIFDAIGAHTGTKGQAVDRAEKTRGIDPNTGKKLEASGTFYPLKAKTGRELLSDSGDVLDEMQVQELLESKAQELGFDSYSQEGKEAVREWLWENYDSVPYKNFVEGWDYTKGEPTISHILPPKNIRSTFAALDPQFKKSANLLGGLGGLAVLGTQSEDAEAGVLSKGLKLSGWKPTTGFSDVDDKITRVVEMSPDEYLREAFDATSGRLGGDYSSWMASNKVSADARDKYTKDMVKGDDFPLPYIDKYSGSQDGRNRALAAKAAGVKTIPVGIVDPPSVSQQIKDLEGELRQAKGGYAKNRIQTQISRLKGEGYASPQALGALAGSSTLAATAAANIDELKLLFADANEKGNQEEMLKILEMMDREAMANPNPSERLKTPSVDAINRKSKAGMYEAAAKGIEKTFDYGLGVQGYLTPVLGAAPAFLRALGELQTENRPEDYINQAVSIYTLGSSANEIKDAASDIKQWYNTSPATQRFRRLGQE